MIAQCTVWKVLYPNIKSFCKLIDGTVFGVKSVLVYNYKCPTSCKLNDARSVWCETVCAGVQQAFSLNDA